MTKLVSLDRYLDEHVFSNYVFMQCLVLSHINTVGKDIRTFSIVLSQNCIFNGPLVCDTC